MAEPNRHDPIPLDYADPPQQQWSWRDNPWLRFGLFWLPLLLVFWVVWVKSSPDPPNIALRPGFAGRTIEAMLGEMGQPTYTRQMTIAEAWELPFRGSFLEKTYSPANPNEAIVQVQELSWERRRTYVTVWFHQVDGKWVAFHGVEWHRRMLKYVGPQAPRAQRTSTTQPEGGRG